MKTSNRFFVLATITAGMIIGGFIFSTIFKFIGGMIIGGLAAFTILVLLFPITINEFIPNVSDQSESSSAKIEVRVIRRKFLHPTRLPEFLGALWGGLALLILFSGDSKVIGKFLILLFLPSLFLMDLSGYQIIKRNEYIDRYGNLLRGFPAKPFGILIMLVFWGAGILGTLATIFR